MYEFLALAYVLNVATLMCAVAVSTVTILSDWIIRDSLAGRKSSCPLIVLHCR